MKLLQLVWIPFLLFSLGCGRSLEKQVRDQVRTLGGAELPQDAVEILEVRESGDRAIAEIQVRTAVKMIRSEGRWEIDEIRIGDRRWEKAEHLRHLLDEERAETTRRKMAAISEAIRRYREGHGEVPQAESFEQLVDLLAPEYLSRVIRLDAWSNPFSYRVLGPDRYELRSSGPDLLTGTADDLVSGGDS